MSHAYDICYLGLLWMPGVTATPIFEGIEGTVPAIASTRALNPRSEVSNNGIAPAQDRVLTGYIRTQAGTCLDSNVNFVVSEKILVKDFCFNFKNSVHLDGFAWTGSVKFHLVLVLSPREHIIIDEVFPPKIRFHGVFALLFTVQFTGMKFIRICDVTVTGFLGRSRYGKVDIFESSRENNFLVCLKRESDVQLDSQRLDREIGVWGRAYDNL